LCYRVTSIADAYGFQPLFSSSSITFLLFTRVTTMFARHERYKCARWDANNTVRHAVAVGRIRDCGGDHCEREALNVQNNKAGMRDISARVSRFRVRSPLGRTHNDIVSMFDHNPGVPQAFPSGTSMFRRR